MLGVDNLIDIEIGKRIKSIREMKTLTQKEFGEQIGVSRDVIGNIEYGRVEVKENIIKLVILKFNINEVWLRTGQGEMFTEPDTISLDEYVKKHGITDLELDIVKTYLELEPQIRQAVLNHFKNNLGKRHDNEIAVTIDNNDIVDPDTFHLTNT